MLASSLSRGVFQRNTKLFTRCSFCSCTNSNSRIISEGRISKETNSNTNLLAGHVNIFGNNMQSLNDIQRNSIHTSSWFFDNNHFHKDSSTIENLLARGDDHLEVDKQANLSLGHVQSLNPTQQIGDYATSTQPLGVNLNEVVLSNESVVMNEQEVINTDISSHLLDKSSSVTDTVDLFATNATTAIDVTQNLGEQTFSSLGLCNYTPVGLIEKILELVHMNLDLPWFGTIAVVAVTFRLLLFPVMINAQKHAMKFGDIRPEVDQVLSKVREAKSQSETLQLKAELDQIYAKHGTSPGRAMLPLFVQCPMFISFFFALRKLSEIPIESFKTGGTLWFTDLTLTDPYYILPLFTVSSLLFMIRKGGENNEMGNMPPELAQTMKNLMLCVTGLSFFFMARFPAAMFCYWSTSNLFSVVQLILLQKPAVRKLLGLRLLDAGGKKNVGEGSFLGNLKAGMKDAMPPEKMK